MKFSTQPNLENETVVLYPLEETDFEELYSVASDPKIWEQHPNQDRWKKDVFKTFFEGAMLSGGAFKIVDKNTGRIVGSTRVYDFNEDQSSIYIGYTFYSRSYWGTGTNTAVKALMLDHFFQYVSRVYFQIGAVNVRSQIAITRLGARKIGEKEVAYFGESPKLNFVYSIERDDWMRKKSNANVSVG